MGRSDRFTTCTHARCIARYNRQALYIPLPQTEPNPVEAPTHTAQGMLLSACFSVDQTVKFTMRAVGDIKIAEKMTLSAAACLHACLPACWSDDAPSVAISFEIDRTHPFQQSVNANRELEPFTTAHTGASSGWPSREREAGDCISTAAVYK